MYFPFLRGRQYELLALKELLENDKISPNIIPIIEPIRFSSTFVNLLKLFVEKNRRIAIVRNPQVGEFISELAECDPLDKNLDSYYKLIDSDCILYAYWMVEGVIVDDINSERIMFLNHDRDCLNVFKNISAKIKSVYTLIPDDRTFKRNVSDNRVLFENIFVKRERNSDYAKNIDEFFTDIHLAFAQEGFVGFSDYSIVGDEFKDTGFAPLAVVIHLVYMNSDKELRIRHFVSDSNFDINDPAGKFGEALRKLVDWIANNDVYESLGLKQLLNCFEESKYPGLGSVKKMSIMHHLELISHILQE